MDRKVETCRTLAHENNVPYRVGQRCDGL